MCACARACVRACMRACVRAYVRACVRVCLRARTHTHKYVRAHTHTCTHTNTHTHTHMHTHTHDIHTQRVNHAFWVNHVWWLVMIGGHDGYRAWTGLLRTPEDSRNRCSHTNSLPNSLKISVSGPTGFNTNPKGQHRPWICRK